MSEIEIPKVTYVSWVDKIVFKKTGLKSALSACSFLLLWFSVSITPLVLSGQLHLVFHNIWLFGAVGITISFLLYFFVRQKLNKHIENLDLIVCSDCKSTYREQIGLLFENLAKERGVFICGLTFTGLLTIFFIGTWYYPSNSPIFDFLGPDWYSNTPGLIARITSISFSILPIMTMLVTGLRYMYYLIKVVRTLNELKFIPSPRTCQRLILPTLNLFLYVSFAFSGMAGLFIVFYRDRLWPIEDFSYLYWLTIVVIILVGILGVILPVSLMHNKIHEIKERRLNSITDKVISYTEENPLDSVDTIIALYSLEEQLELNNKLDSFFVSWKYTTFFVLSIVIPIFIAVVQIILQDFLT